MPLPLLEHIVYGPVRSRRLGRSLGINLLPPGMKICTMNCAYCQYGWTRLAASDRAERSGWPTAQAVERAIEARLARAAADNETIDRVTVAGHGEPTLHPRFDAVIERLAAVRDRLAPDLPLAILSNSTTAGVAAVARGLARLDERYMKLDAGDPFTGAAVNASRVPFTTIVDALGRLPPVVIQAMFVTDAVGRVDNTRDGAVAAWLDALDAIRPSSVHLYTLDRAPALGSLRPAPPARLREIAERVRRAGYRAEVFAGSAPRRARSAAQEIDPVQSGE